MDFLDTFSKNTQTKFHENPSGGSRIVPRGRKDGRTDGRTDMTKLIVAFRNLVNKPKNKNKLNYINIDPVPRSKHSPSLL